MKRNQKDCPKQDTRTPLSGIYTTTDPRLAFCYAKDGIVFACLALPGRQYDFRCGNKSISGDVL